MLLCIVECNKYDILQYRLHGRTTDCTSVYPQNQHSLMCTTLATIFHMSLQTLAYDLAH